MGPHCVLTRRSTITADVLEAAAAAAAHGKRGVALLPRLSAAAVAPPPPQQQQQQQRWEREAGAAQPSADGSAGGGVAIADASVAAEGGERGSAGAVPPLWAMAQLAAHFRASLRLSLFNMDLIVRAGQGQGHWQQQGVPQQDEQQDAQREQQQQQQPLVVTVVDVNYLPGYDKVPGAEPLFAAWLADACASCRAQRQRQGQRQTAATTDAAQREPCMA
jgi:hypothetical protein